MKHRGPDDKKTRRRAEPAQADSRTGESGAALAPPDYGIDFVDNRTGMPDHLKAGIEALSGMSMARVRVHRNSGEPAQLHALAYTLGNDIHLAPGQESHLPHEAWHVVQQRQGRVKPTLHVGGVAVSDDPRLESEADQMAVRALHQPTGTVHPRASLYRQPGAQSQQVAQRAVRTGGGATKIKEGGYLSGGSKSAVGTRFSVAALIADNVKRVFSSVAELESYANGGTDYIGDVATTSAGTFWYRLPKDKLTVLGESHENPNGNVEDVILGLRTSRFMYEPFNELAGVSALNIPFTGTEARLAKVNAGRRVGALVDRKKFNPDLENIVIKALTGASIVRNEFIPANPSTMDATAKQKWGARAATSDYSYGERVALYLSIGIHLAADISKHDFGPENWVESLFIRSARDLKDYYVANQAALDQFMQAKDGDDLIGVYELTAPDNFKNLPVIKDFTLVLHEYGSRYIEQLGGETRSAALEAHGTALSRNLGATLQTMSAAREEIMWGRIQHAKANKYLIVGMGDAHRQNLEAKLKKAGIANEEVEKSLKRQSAEVNAKWVP